MEMMVWPNTKNNDLLLPMYTTFPMEHAIGDLPSMPAHSISCSSIRHIGGQVYSSATGLVLNMNGDSLG